MPAGVRPLYSVVTPERSVAQDEVHIMDLGVNPLSALFITLRPLNETSTPANYRRYLDICASINAVRVLYRGQSVLSMRGEDLAAMNLFRRNVEPREANTVITDNIRRSVVLPIFFGRFGMDATDCFPASRRGELTLEIDWDIADTGYDNLRYQVDAVELLGARPTFYERCITINRTFPAVGQNDIALPIGNEYRGMLLWGNTGPTGASPAPSFGRMEVLVDNQQTWLAGMDFEQAMSMNSCLGGRKPVYDAHQHTSAAAASPTSNGFDQGLGGWEKYAFVDFDLLRNDDYNLSTAGANSVTLRALAETADAVRVTPVERVLIGA